MLAVRAAALLARELSSMTWKHGHSACVWRTAFAEHRDGASLSDSWNWNFYGGRRGLGGKAPPAQAMQLGGSRR